MKKIAIHLELNNLTDKDIEEVVGQLTFNSMKSDLAKFEPVSVKWRKGFSFLRKGNVGDSLHHFIDSETGESTVLGRHYEESIKTNLDERELDAATYDFISNLAFQL